MLHVHELNHCPACGEPGTPNTLDHYLPKGRYPHFCVTPLNLFPMCDACQQAKGEKTGDADSRSEEHTSELQSLMRISYAVFCLKQTINRKSIIPLKYHDQSMIHLSIQ